MIFAIIVLVALVPLRRAGWFISKIFLYWSKIPVVIIASIIWGSLIAYIVHILILWQNPGLIIKIIFGYGFGAYLSVPDYGLFAEGTMTDEASMRNTIITFVSLIVFILSSVAFAFLDS